MGVPSDHWSAAKESKGRERIAIRKVFRFIEIPRKRRWAMPTLLQFRIFLSVGLTIEGSGNEILRRDLLAAHVGGDRFDGRGSDSARILQNRRVHFAILHGLLGLGLS